MEDTIEKVRGEIHYGLSLNEYRDLLEKNGIGTCFFCDKLEFKDKLKQVNVDSNTKFYVCSECYKKRRRVLDSKSQEIIDETS